MYSSLKLLLLLAALGIQPALAHEAWILPWGFHQDETRLARAHIQVGQNFSGTSQLYNPDKFVRMEVMRNGETMPIKGRIGDLPAISHQLSEPGLHVLVYQSTGSVISYSEWEKFRNFTDKEGIAWAQQAHRERGLAEKDFDELFVRYAKALITWQNPEGQDSRTGMPFEIVALNNPYVGVDRVDIEVLWLGEPYRNAQVAVFAKPSSGDTTRTDLFTDSNGRLSVPLKKGVRYLLNSVAMEPLDDGRNTPVWRSHWASMTLQLPDESADD